MVPSTGLFGSSYNKNFIDMSPPEKEKEPDMRAGEFKGEHMGYIYASHTSHSYEVGRSRMATEDVTVRLLSYRTFTAADKISTREQRCPRHDVKWTVFC